MRLPRFLCPAFARHLILVSTLAVLTLSSPALSGQELSKHPLFTTAEQFNSSCPRMVDRDTRLDSAVFIPANTFRYDYTLVNYTAGQVNGEALAGYLRPRIISNVSRNPEMKVQRDQRVTMVFHYRDRNGDFITEISLEPGDYLY